MNPYRMVFYPRVKNSHHRAPHTWGHLGGDYELQMHPAAGFREAGGKQGNFRGTPRGRMLRTEPETPEL